MKYKAIIACWALALAVMAAPQTGYREPTIKQDLATVVQSTITNLPDWIDLTNQIAMYDVNKATVVTDIAGISNTNTVQALNDMLTIIQNVKVMSSDEKRLLRAISSVTTNPATLNQ